uniref:Uncharacterized protein n=2 Tax=Escherichia coli TaxID=562 RepID=A0A7U1E0S1_ECOLX|nr:hypothetical protein [Escherichia coli]
MMVSGARKILFKISSAVAERKRISHQLYLVTGTRINSCITAS